MVGRASTPNLSNRIKPRGEKPEIAGARVGINMGLLNQILTKYLRSKAANARFAGTLATRANL